MRQLSRLLLFSAVAVAVAVPLYTVQAQPSQDPLQIYREAGASDNQQKAIRDLGKEFETTARVKVERANNLLKKMQEYSLQPLPDEKEVLSTQDEINTLQADMANSRIKLMLKIRGLLSPEQRDKLISILKERRSMNPQGPGPN